MSKNKKKDKPYYKSNTSNKNELSDGKYRVDLMKSTSFMLGFGFLITIYSRYIVSVAFSRITAIFGLGVMLYGIITSIKDNKEKYKNNTVKGNKKLNVTLDYGMGVIILVGILYNLYILFINLK